MRVTEEQTVQISRWLESKGFRRRCPACGHSDFSIADIIDCPLEHDGRISKETVSAVVLVCAWCGELMMFSAEMMGL